MKTSLLVVALCVINCLISFSQTEKQYTALFYNVENFFDCIDDSITADEEFTPEGSRYWTHWRFNQKCKNISKAIVAAIGWGKPVVIGLCEIENRYVLEKLINDTPLNQLALKIIHKESPDHRGIDVACLYNSEVFYPLVYRYYPILSDDQRIEPTREILYLSGILDKKDTLHFFMNHWSSRYSGVLETKMKRGNAAKVLQEKIAHLQENNPDAKIVIMGDFNDQPFDESIVKYLNAKRVDGNIKKNVLYNLSYAWLKEEKGTLKYKSQWFVFDQILVSGALLSAAEGIGTSVNKASVCTNGFLLEDDGIFGGRRPHRTYHGFKYKGGFSDHLPVKLILAED